MLAPPQQEAPRAEAEGDAVSPAPSVAVGLAAPADPASSATGAGHAAGLSMPATVPAGAETSVAAVPAPEKAPLAPAALGEGIEPGRSVEICGTDMSGSQGTVEEWLEAKGRWRVRFASGIAKNFKPANVRVVEPRKEQRADATTKAKKRKQHENPGGLASEGEPPPAALGHAGGASTAPRRSQAPVAKKVAADSSLSHIMERLREADAFSEGAALSTSTSVVQIHSLEAPQRAPAAETPASEVPASVNLAGTCFTKAELAEYLKKLQAKLDVAGQGNVLVDSQDRFILFHLAMYYPHFDKKLLRAPVKGIQYGVHPNFPTNKCFKILFDDGTDEPVSLNKCSKEVFLAQRKRKADQLEASAPSAKRTRQEVVVEVMEPERNRTDVGLKLIREEASAHRDPHAARWEYPLMDEEYRCFAGYMRCPFPDDVLERFFDQARSGTKWDSPVDPRSGEPLPRKTAWMVASGCTCTYRYGGVDVDPQEFSPWILELMERYMPLCGIPSKEHWPNSCNLNLYEDGCMSVGWHADDEKLFQGKFKDIRIISISLGETRTFEFRTIDAEEDGERLKTRMSLHNGDICTMEGLTQKYYHHRVPKEAASSPRINLTFRWITKHQPNCPAS